MFFSNEVTEKRIIHYWPDIEKKKLVYAGYIDSASMSTTSSNMISHGGGGLKFLKKCEDPNVKSHKKCEDGGMKIVKKGVRSYLNGP